MIMPRLKNANHEAFATKYAKAAIKGEGKVVASKIYKEVYAVQDSTSRSSASELLTNQNIQNRIQEILLAKNPAEKVSEYLSDLLQANKQVLTATGDIVELRDNSTRLGALNLWAKIAGVFGHEGNIIDARSVQFNMNKNDTNLFNSLFIKIDTLTKSILNTDQSSQDNNSPVQSTKPVDQTTKNTNTTQ